MHIIIIYDTIYEKLKKFDNKAKELFGSTAQKEMYLKPTMFVAFLKSIQAVRRVIEILYVMVFKNELTLASLGTDEVEALLNDITFKIQKAAACEWGFTLACSS